MVELVLDRAVADLAGNRDIHHVEDLVALDLEAVAQIPEAM